MTGILAPNEYDVVTTGDIPAWLRREFPAHPLFLFRMRDSRRYGIGEWRGGIDFIEHCAIGSDLRTFDRRMATNLRVEVATTEAENRRGIQNILTAKRGMRDRAHKEQIDTLRDIADYAWRHSHDDSQYLRALAGRL